MKCNKKKLVLLMSPDELHHLADYLVSSYEADIDLKGLKVDWSKVKYAIPITNSIGFFDDWSINWVQLKQDLK